MNECRVVSDENRETFCVAGLCEAGSHKTGVTDPSYKTSDVAGLCEAGTRKTGVTDPSYKTVSNINRTGP